MIQALIFDLDDTLYRERDFVESGYSAVALHLSSIHELDRQRIFDTMIETLDCMGRDRVMTAVQEILQSIHVPIEEMVSVYRNHRPVIRLYPGYYDLLVQLSHQYRLGIITDGLPEVQERKVQALGLNSLMDAVVYTWKYGEERQKPHPNSFNLMLQTLAIEASNALYVGDNPLKDCTGAHGVGMQYAQVGMPHGNRKPLTYMPDESPDYFIDSLFQLNDILQEMN